MNVDAFLADLAAQSDRYRAMIGLAERTISLLNEQPLSEALPLLDRKQELLSEISAIDVRLAPIRADWERIRATLSEADRSRLEAALREARDILGKLVELEDRAREAMQLKHLASRRDLEDQVARARLRGAYGGGAR